MEIIKIAFSMFLTNDCRIVMTNCKVSSHEFLDGCEFKELFKKVLFEKCNFLNVSNHLKLCSV